MGGRDRRSGRPRQPGGERHADHRGAGRRAPAHREAHRLHVGRLGLPGGRPRGDCAARDPLRLVPGGASHPRPAPRRARDRAAVRGKAGRVHEDLQPQGLLARAASSNRPRAAGRGARPGHRGGQDRRHLRPPRPLRGRAHRGERRRPAPDRGDPGPDGSGSPLREPGGLRHALGAPQRREGLRAGARGHGPGPAGGAGAAPRGRRAGHHRRPRLRPDHALHRPLPRVRAPAG